MPEVRQQKAFPPSFPALVQQFFTEYLMAQRALSSRTVASYRDAMTLFLGYATQHLGKTPMALQLMDITPELVLKFLAHLERERHNSVRSRNLRLTALRAFLKFAGRRDVTALHTVEQVMAVPMKRFERPLLGHLTRPEMIAVLGQPGVDWTSQRDHLLLSLLYNTGARVSEIVSVRVVDVVLDSAACVHLHGKGRKDRSVPLWKSTAAAIRAWLHANPDLRGSAALLPNRSGHPPVRHLQGPARCRRPRTAAPARQRRIRERCRCTVARARWRCAPSARCASQAAHRETAWAQPATCPQLLRRHEPGRRCRRAVDRGAGRLA